jgi:hypothetical protein
MSKSIETGIPSVYISDVEKLIQKVKQTTDENVEVSFEFIIASLFPTSWQNIQNTLSYQYTQGYIQGQKDAEEERRARICACSDNDCYCE